MNAPRRATTSLVAYAVLSVVAIVFLMPLAWMFATSVKPESQAVDGTIGLIPHGAVSAGRDVGRATTGRCGRTRR